MAGLRNVDGVLVKDNRGSSSSRTAGGRDIGSAGGAAAGSVSRPGAGPDTGGDLSLGPAPQRALVLPSIDIPGTG